MAEYTTSEMAVLWVAEGPNRAPNAIPCAVLESISIPRGGLESTYCWNAQIGKYERVSKRRGTPDEITFDIEELEGLTASDIETYIRKDCPLAFYVGVYECTPRRVFTGADRMKVIQNALLETEAESGMMGRDAGVDTMLTTSWNADAVEKAFALEEYGQTTTEDQTIRDIAISGIDTCHGICGPISGKCDDLVAVCEADAGVAAGNVLVTANGGATWAAAAANPWAGVNTDISSVVAFQMTETAWRWLCALGTGGGGAGANMEVAYSDDSGATWTVVDMGAATVGEAADHSGSLFALDRYHIWLGLDSGDMWFSNDGGATWTEQASANAGVDPINYVYFMDEREGCAVGGDGVASNFLMTTRNGGTDWAVTTTILGAATDVPWCVTMHDRNRFFVGCDQGELWFSEDGGTNWTRRLPDQGVPASATSIDEIYDITRVDEYRMFISGECTIGGNPYGFMGWTSNGGYDWEFRTTVQANAVGDGMYAIVACHWNRAISVGGPSTTPLGMIYSLTD